MEKNNIIQITPEILRSVKKSIKCAIEYEKLTGRKLGITGEVGEILVCKKLNLNLLKNDIAAGYDALDNRGKRYQIKTRKGETNKGRLSSFSKHEFDYAVLAILDKEYNLVELWQTTFGKIKPVINKNKGRNPSLRDFKKTAEKFFQGHKTDIMTHTTTYNSLRIIRPYSTRLRYQKL